MYTVLSDTTRAERPQLSHNQSSSSMYTVLSDISLISVSGFSTYKSVGTTLCLIQTKKDVEFLKGKHSVIEGIVN